MSFIETIDEKVLAVCTKFAHAVQRTCGVTSYGIARVGIALTAISAIANLINYYIVFLPQKTPFFMAFMDFIVVLGCIWRSIAAKQAEDSVGSNTKPLSLMNAQMERPFFRTIWLFFVAFDLPTLPFVKGPFIPAFLQHGAFALGCAIFWYFIKVDPLPPGTSKVREWFNSFGRQPVPVPVREN